jgi:hypothetical protein
LLSLAKFDLSLSVLSFHSYVCSYYSRIQYLRQVSPAKVFSAALNATLYKLRYVEGASWDFHRVCFSKTREKAIGEIHSWINNPSSTNILLLTGVAGSSKSTIAHTIAQHCHTNKQVLSSFFFDRETDGRNNSRHWISTLATDICRRDARISSCISAAIQDDESLAMAPIFRQFEELILRPSDVLPTDRPLVIVLDVLDEGSNVDLLRILSNDASRLPTCFRISLTSRMNAELGAIRHKPHVRSIELHIHEQGNLYDIGAVHRSLRRCTAQSCPKAGRTLGARAQSP